MHAGSRADDRPRTGVTSVSAVVNVQSGSLKGCDVPALERRLREVLEGAAFSLASIDASGRPIQSALDAAIAEGSDCLLVAGGDGSVSAAAAAAWKHDRLLAVLPGGTMNLFARTLGMPLDLDAALEALAGATEATMDIATANGTPFIHQYTVGLHADAVRLRQRASAPGGSGRIGKLVATARAFAAVVLDPPRLSVALTADGAPTTVQELSALSVSNNPFGEGHLPYADRPDHHVLGLYRAAPLTTLAAMRLVADIVTGAHADNENVITDTAHTVELHFPERWLARHPNRRALRDGELVTLVPHVRIQSHPGAVRVLRPAAPSGTESGTKSGTKSGTASGTGHAR